MRLCYLGPVERQGLLQSWCSPGVTLEARSPGGPETINNAQEEAMAVPPQIEATVRAEGDGFSAVILGCFGDPGLDSTRESVKIPVVGIGEGSLLIALTKGDRIGIATPLPELVGPTWRQVRALGIDRRVVAVLPLGLRVQAIRDKPDEAREAVRTAGLRLVEQGADVIVPGCGSLSLLAESVAGALPVPIMNPLRVGVRLAELLVGLRTA